MTTTNKDFKVKHGLSVSGGATFGQAIEIGEPTAGDHAATKDYVDNSIRTVTVDAATTANINIATDTVAGDTIDFVLLAEGTRILVKNQTNAVQNGIYVVNASGPATRALDYISIKDLFTGGLVFVINGSVNIYSYWSLSTEASSELGIIVDTDPLNFIFVGPVKTKQDNPIYLDNNEIALDVGVIATLVADGTELDSNITASSLTSFGVLDSLTVAGEVDAFSLTAQEDLGVSGDTTLNTLNVSGEAVFNDATFNGSVGTINITTEINVPDPTDPTHAATKDYVDNLLDQESVEITTIDDLSNYFNGYNSRFLPTYKGLPVTLQNEFNLLLTIDGIIQSVGSPDYVWQSVMPRVGFRIDNDGYIAFPEPVPVGSSFDARVLVGSATTTQTKVYPFKAMDIVLGGY